MQFWRSSVLCVLGLVATAISGAQEGFPLDGTWRGQLDGSGKVPITVVLVMQWDGQKITGTINPGPGATPIGEATLDPDGWKVTLAAHDAKGQAISFAGALADLGAYDRKIDGTWTEGARSFHVRMVRE